MKLEKDFILGGRFNNKRILGIKFGKNTLYENKSRWKMSYTYDNSNNYNEDSGLPTFNSDFSYTTKIVANPDSTRTVTITASNVGVIPEFIEFNAYSTGLYTRLISVDSIDDIHGITGMYFGGCTSLKSVDLSNADTSTIISSGYNGGMYFMFDGCSSLTTLDLSRLDTSKVTNMAYAFRTCSSLTELNLSNFNTSNVTNIGYMFYNCSRLESLNLSNFDIAEGISTSQMLGECRRLIELRLDNCNNYTISRIINSEGFPTGTTSISDTRLIYCKESQIGDLQPPDGWDFEPVPEEVPEEPEIPDVPEEPEVPDVPVDPEEPEEPEEIPLYNPGEFAGTNIAEVRTMVDSSYTDLYKMFDNCYKLVSVNTQDWDTSNVTIMRNMFNNCQSLTELDLSNFNVGKVTNMDSMFSGCIKLTELDLSSFYTDNMVTANTMFFYCSNLEVLDIRNFKAPSNGQTEYVFTGCSKLRVIRMDDCNNTTIRRLIINQEDFPTGDITDENGEVIERLIYCKDSNLVDLFGNRLYPPSGWRFEIVPED